MLNPGAHRKPDAADDRRHSLYLTSCSIPSKTTTRLPSIPTRRFTAPSTECCAPSIRTPSFLIRRHFSQLQEDQTGRYFGLGIMITTRFGKVTVISPPFKGSPAEKVGLRVGDVISLVEGQSTTGLDVTAVVNRLKGPQGTPVHITIVRPGVADPIQITVYPRCDFQIHHQQLLHDSSGYRVHQARQLCRNIRQ